VKKTFFIALPLLLVFLIIVVYSINGTLDNREEIVISIPYSEYIRNIDTNHFKLWLEEQTGLSLKFNIIYETLSADYLRSMFASDYVTSDAFFSMLGGDDWDEWNAVIQEFGEKGYILPLNDYAERSVYLNAIFESFTDYDLRAAMTSSDGNIYYMPGFDPSISERHFQVLWLNQNWLRHLNLNVPQTTDDLRNVLYAFKNHDPNGNGLHDEIPLAGSHDIPSRQIYNVIINAFVYNDPDNSCLFLENGAVRFAPMTDEWREAMKYLNSLYANGLIAPFTYDHSILTGIANSPWNILGGFASRSVTDVLFQSNPELINAFLYIAPLTGPNGTRNTTVRTPLPKPAGVITSNSKNPEAIFKLFDLMLSEEAFLIGRYGEEGADWVRADITDADFYGNRASIRVINRLWNRVQNKHINELGPFFAYPEYADGVTFSGFEVSQEYANARAYWVYEQYKPNEYIRTTLLHGNPDIQSLRRSIDTITEISIEAFITGASDPLDDAVWEAHLQMYREVGIQQFLDAVMEVLS
jgi:putative aldouronate transport system substrate-binding protein